jgi:glycosyltransferase involved in cell wall biosynthesis
VAAPATPAVSVVVPTYQGRHHLEELLPSLLQQTLPHEVIVVDNASTDGTGEFAAEQWPDVRVISLPENRGFGKAANAGVSASNAPTVVLLNNDIVCTPNFLARLVAALDPGQGVVMAAPILVRRQNETRIDTAGIVVDRTLHGFNYLYGEPVDVLADDLFDRLPRAVVPRPSIAPHSSRSVASILRSSPIWRMSTSPSGVRRAAGGAGWRRPRSRFTRTPGRSGRARRPRID